MIYSINSGHCANGKATGAYYKGFYESKITRAVGNELIRLLKNDGHTVHNSTVNYANSQNAYLKRSVEMVNNKNVDIAISLHCNSSVLHKGNGIEIFTWNGKEHAEAKNILKEFEKAGFKNRGVKKGNNLYFIKHTKPKSLLVEMFFLDNNKDRELYHSLGYKGIAKLIYNAIAS